jgi:kynurenine formamidase
VPSYDELNGESGAPPGSSWGLFGAGDELGSVNFATAERIAEAARLVRRGQVFNLDYPINAFEPYPTGTRKSAQHHIFSNNPHHRDDYLDSLYLQSTTQIDSLRHMRHPVHGFYGGTADEAVGEGSPSLGIQNWAESGIVGRGVLLDVARYLAEVGRPIVQFSNHMITTADLDATLARQGVQLAPGDVLLIRTGWTHYFLTEMDAHARKALSHQMVCPGLVQSEQTVRWLWDHQLTMVAADNIALEAMPPAPDTPFRTANDGGPARGLSNDGMMHRILIPLLGLAIGEMWALEELANDCAQDQVYEFLLVAKPLNLIGGVGSPANALAIK